jgi:P4 family phage/plasmid primase-like protien
MPTKKLKPHHNFIEDLKKKLKKVPDLSPEDIQAFASLYENVTQQEIDTFLNARLIDTMADIQIANDSKKANEMYRKIDKLFIEVNPDIAIYEQENNITFCKYEHGVYTMLTDQQMELMVDSFFIEKGMLEHRTSTRVIKDTMARIARSLTIKDGKRFTDEILQSQEHLVNLQDGLLNPNTGDIQPHRKDFYSLSQIQQVFNEEQSMDMFQSKFLDMQEIASTGFTELLQEVTGYVLFDKGNSLEKLIVFYGPTARNGKTMLTKIYTGLMGARYVSHLSLATLCNPSAHAMRGIVGKRLNISDEVSGEFVKAGNLTSITGRGSITINPKGKDDFSYLPQCSFILCANSQPKFMEDIGLQARMIIVPFYHYVKESERIVNFPDLILKNEGSAILKWALKGYQRLQENKGFTITEESKRLLKQNNENNNDIVNFLTNYVYANGDFENTKIIKKTDLWGMFQNFCLDESITHKYKKAMFYQAVENHGMRHKTIEEVRTGDVRGYKGIVYNDEFETMEMFKERLESIKENNK